MDWLGTNKEAQVELVAGQSKEWHDRRSKGIGSSDIAVILGVSPWKKYSDLLLEKKGLKEKFQGNWATDRGNRLEPIAREMYEKRVKAKFPAEFLSDGIYLANLDGINHELKRGIEIKCPGKDAHTKALMGVIPEYYFPQVQWQMMVSGYEEWDYISWDGISSDLVIVRVKPDKRLWETMKREADKFWACVLSGTLPPVQVAENQVEDQELERLLNERFKLKQEIDALTIGFDLANDKIKEIVKDGEALCAGFKIKWTEAKGSVNYKSIPELQSVDLEKYRGDSVRRFTITKVGKDD